MIETNPKVDIVIKKIRRLASEAYNAYLGGRLDRALKKVSQGEKLIGSFQGDLPKELKLTQCYLLFSKSAVKLEKGYLTSGFEYTNELLTLAKKNGSDIEHANELLTIEEKYGSKLFIIWAFTLFGEYYWAIGDLEKAYLYYDRGITLGEKISNIEDKELTSSQLFTRHRTFSQVFIYSRLLGIAIEKGDLELAGKYFKKTNSFPEKDETMLNLFFNIFSK